MPMPRTREEHIQRSMEKCRHFNGIQNECCKANVAYPTPIPCIKLEHRPELYGKCGSFVQTTREEAEAQEVEHEEAMARMRMVMAVVGPWRTWTKQNRVAKAEVIECPVCKGRLHLSQAAYNGHVHGKCETPDCVFWME